MVRCRKDVFNEVAALYDEVRPGYAPAVVDAAVMGAGLAPAGRILEIGCGTGQLTAPLAARGYSILALEPGDAMAALAGHNCRAYPQVTILPTSFEAWPPDGQTFDMVASAQAFHWIAPDAGCAKAASVLKPGGAIALLWHLDVSQDTPFWQATQPVYDAYFQAAQGETSGLTLGEKVALYAEAIRRCAAFEPLQEMRHTWEQTYRDCAYMKLLHTLSDHRTLPEPDKMHFFRAIAAVVDRFGGVVHRRYETLLLLARRR
jgi:SAM-dependent methyltransferase